MQLETTKLTLLCIDIQLAFLDEDSWGGTRNNKDAEKPAQELSRNGEGLVPTLSMFAIARQTQSHRFITALTGLPLIPYAHRLLVKLSSQNRLIAVSSAPT